MRSFPGNCGSNFNHKVLNFFEAGKFDHTFLFCCKVMWLLVCVRSSVPCTNMVTLERFVYRLLFDKQCGPNGNW